MEDNTNTNELTDINDKDVELNIDLNSLAYGNLTYNYLPYLEVKNHFSELIDSFLDFPYPQIDESILEIENLIEFQKNAKQSKNWEKQYNFNKNVDSNLEFVLEKFYLKNELIFDKELLANIRTDISALILQLKVYYQRARPFQVAFYSKQNFVPFESNSANTPSYPSGHATQIYFIGLVEIFKNPQKEKEIKKFCNMVAKTREIMGVHFESDTNFGKIIATALSKHPKIKEIYFKK